MNTLSSGRNPFSRTRLTIWIVPISWLWLARLFWGLYHFRQWIRWVIPLGQPKRKRMQTITSRQLTNLQSRNWRLDLLCRPILYRCITSLWWLLSSVPRKQCTFYSNTNIIGTLICCILSWRGAFGYLPPFMSTIASIKDPNLEIWWQIPIADMKENLVAYINEKFAKALLEDEKLGSSLSYTALRCWFFRLRKRAKLWALSRVGERGNSRISTSMNLVTIHFSSNEVL